MKTFVKVDERTLRVVTDIGQNDYNFAFLQRQRRLIKAQRARELDMRDEELAEVDEMLAQCKKLGVSDEGRPQQVVPLERLGVATVAPALVEVPAPPSRAARIWAFLTKLRGPWTR